MNKYLFCLILLAHGFGMTGQKLNPDDFFYNYEIKSFNTDYLSQISRTPASGVVHLKLDRWNLELEHSNLIAPNYKSVDESGNLLSRGENHPIPMQGYTEKGGRVSLTIGEDFIYGFIRQGSETYYIEPAAYYSSKAKNEEFIIYDTKDVKPGAEGKCGVHETAKIKGENSELGSRAPGDCNVIEYAICHDFSTVQRYNGAAGAEAFSVGVTNNVNTDYLDAFEENYRFVIVGHYNAVGGDPTEWSNSTDPFVLLPNFRGWGNATLASTFSYDVASLWTERDFDGSTIGLAYLDVICGNSRYNVLQNFSNNADGTRVLVSHELGHNCGSSHDGSNGFIMAPSVPPNPQTITAWSPASINQIDSYLGGQSCFYSCEPRFSFSSPGSGITESGSSGSAGVCNEPFTLINIPVNSPSLPLAGESVTLTMSIAGSSTATATFDYEIVNSSITFTASSPTTQNFQLRLINDQITEGIESIVANLVVSAGTAELGENTTYNLSIGDDDFYTTPCCTSTTAFYGETGSYFSVPTVFDGSTSDSKSRMLLRASELQSIGLGAGFLDRLSLYVFTKQSTAPFNNFRIGMKEVSENSLNSSAWYETTQVFMGNVTTQENWNNFAFTTPFYWNGISNLYVEFCFNNTVPVGQDRIGFHATGTTGATTFQFNQYTSGDGCTAQANGGSAYTSGGADVGPIALLRRTEIPTNVEKVVNSEASTRISAGETALLRSVDGEILAKIENTGSTNIGCISTSINTAGDGKSSLPNGNGDYSEKTFFVEAGSNGSYELTLFYAESETTVWGSGLPSLQILRSSQPIASSNAGNRTFTSTSAFETGAGSPGAVTYSASFSGSAYYAITDGSNFALEAAEIGGVLEDSDLVIVEEGRGLLLKNSQGNQYLLGVSSLGVLSASPASLATASASFNERDLCILEASKSLYIRRNSGSYTRINIDADGGIVSANVTNIPTINVSLETGNLGLLEAGTGIIFQNTEQECYRLYVDDLGMIRTIGIICP